MIRNNEHAVLDEDFYYLSKEEEKELHEEDYWKRLLNVSNWNPTIRVLNDHPFGRMESKTDRTLIEINYCDHA